MSHGTGHSGGHGEAPTTEIGRVVRDVLSAAPSLVTTLRSGHDDHGHDEHDGLDSDLGKLIAEIQEGEKEARSPAGLIANARLALDDIYDKFGGLKSPRPTEPEPHRRPHHYLLAAVLLALLVVAGGFLLVGGGADAVYAAGADPDYRQLAYPGAVETPNLASWLAWLVLILALAGVAIWAMSHLSAPRPTRTGDNAKLRDLYERGLISYDLYDRGRELAPDETLRLSSLAKPLPPTKERARALSALVVALADALRHRLRLDVVAPRK
jgi:hypothetical protein